MSNRSAFLFKSQLDGESVRILLRRQKLRQNQVARRLRISAPQFYHLLEGKYLASPETIAALSVILKAKASAIVKRNRNNAA